MSNDEYDSLFEGLAEQMIDGGVALPAQIKGCSELDIAALEKAAGLTLPAAYRAFLRTMGNGAGDLLKASDFLATAVPRLQEWAKELMVESGADVALPEDALVFAMHQGYQFWYMPVSSADPPVYYFSERAPFFRRISDRFTSHMQKCVESHREIHRHAGLPPK